MYSNKFFLWTFILLQTLAGEAHGRPSRAEKEASRAAFWGLLADTYRALNCFSGALAEKCIEPIMTQALNHAGHVDDVLSEGDEKFVPILEDLRTKARVGNLGSAEAALNSLQGRLIREFASATVPAVIPDLELGQRQFMEHCFGCHGVSDSKKGPLVEKLKSAPKPLWAAWRFGIQRPLGIYAVLVHGADDSEMLPVVDFMDVDEMWSIAFYVTSLLSGATRRADETSGLLSWFDSHKDDFSLVTLTKSSDQELQRLIKTLGRDCGVCEAEIHLLRHDWLKLAPRLGEDVKDARQAAEARGLTILIVLIAVTSIGFAVILSRRARVK